MRTRTMILTLPLLLLATTVVADEASDERLASIGQRFERALLLPSSERNAELGKLADSIGEVLAALPSDRLGAGRLLAGEIRFALGEAEAARQQFELAHEYGKREEFRDDASFARIRSLEAQGLDEEASKAWSKWLEKHDESLLRSEALLARAWNAVRRDRFDEARADCEELASEFPWIAQDARFALLGATLSWYEGDFEAALARIRDLDSAPAVYLKGLCHRERGEILPAAAAFQEVAQRHGDSELADPARIAKADVFLASGAFQSAAGEYERVVAAVRRDDVREEARLRHAACVLLGGRTHEAIDLLEALSAEAERNSIRARARYLRSEALFAVERHEEALAEYHLVLSAHFDHELAASAQYRIARSLDALGRSEEATSAYRAVVSGYPSAQEGPAAAYLAGVGLLAQSQPRAAAPYFQLVLDRYAREGTGGKMHFASAEHGELAEAALCLLEYSYWKAGDLGQVTGVPHLTLQKMPPSGSVWRAWAHLFDADALASQGRHAESNEALGRLLAESPRDELIVPANRLLAWNHAQLGETALALEIEERVLREHAHLARAEELSGATLRRAHLMFNDQRWEEAAVAYDDFLGRFPSHEERFLALYQAGLCFERLEQGGDAVDRWEKIFSEAPAHSVAERAWMRAGDLYFQTEHFDEAKRCFHGLLEHFEGTDLAAQGHLRVAQCEYNAGNDVEALEAFARVVSEHAGTAFATEAASSMEQALYRLGQREDGAELLARLVEEHPESPFAADAQFEIATRKYEEKAWEAAADEFRRVVTQFPAYSAADRAQYLLGDALLSGGRRQDAAHSWEQFLIFFPGSPLASSVQFRLGSLRFEEGDYLQAAVDFTSVLSAKTSRETRRAARFNLALCQDQLDDVEAARSTLLEYRRDQEVGDPRAAEVALRLGEFHERAGEFRKAIEEFEVALSHAPDASLAPEIHYRMGTCHQQLDDVTAAIAAYQRSLDSGRTGDAARVAAAANLAAIHEDRGDTSRALVSYRTLVRETDDPELASAAQARITELEASSH